VLQDLLVQLALLALQVHQELTVLQVQLALQEQLDQQEALRA
jgi:hypothetical protein